MKLRKAPLAIATLAFTGLALTACGGGAIAESDVEDQVSAELEKQIGTAPKDVDCPDDLKAEKGEEMRCTLTAPDGTEIGLTVTVDSVDGDTAHYNIQVDEEPME